MKIFKTILFLSFTLSVLFLFSTVWNFDNSTAFDTISTFLSITIGFTITALSIIGTSSFSKELYKLEDSTNNSKTLLHVLIDQFKISTLIFIATIGLILVYKFGSVSTETLFTLKKYPISFTIFLKSSIWYLTIVSFVTFIRLFNTFSKFVIKSATK
jgi:hypothetical protein